MYYHICLNKCHGVYYFAADFGATLIRGQCLLLWGSQQQICTLWRPLAFLYFCNCFVSSFFGFALLVILKKRQFLFTFYKYQTPSSLKEWWVKSSPRRQPAFSQVLQRVTKSVRILRWPWGRWRRARKRNCPGWLLTMNALRTNCREIALCLLNHAITNPRARLV